MLPASRGLTPYCKPELTLPASTRAIGCKCLWLAVQQSATPFNLRAHPCACFQVIMGHELETSRLLRARARMQQRYLSQFEDLYGDDFHLVTLPLLEEEVRGVQQIRDFSVRLVSGSSQPEASGSAEPAPGSEHAGELAALRQENAALRQELAVLEARTA